MVKIIVCKRCVMDTTDSEIRFDDRGVCNKCTQALKTLNSPPFNYSLNQKNKLLKNIISEIKKDGQNKPFDCIFGISGGLDSTYGLYKAKELGLRPLAVHLDNGWNSELAQKNIESLLKKLDIDLYTYVINWEEFKDLQLSFLKASIPDCEIPSDHAIIALLYQVAAKYKLHFILSGTNLSTESVRATNWSNGIYDWKYISSIHEKFGNSKLVTYPRFSLPKLLYYRFILGIKKISFLDYLDYQKEKAFKTLSSEINYRYYGDKHYESIFTKFFQAFILPAKFGFDKRKIHLSSLICSNQITRQEALKELQKPLYDKNVFKEEKEYVIKKLGLKFSEFRKILNQPVRSFRDYPSYQKEWYYGLALKINELYKILSANKYFY